MNRVFFCQLVALGSAAAPWGRAAKRFAAVAALGLIVAGCGKATNRVPVFKTAGRISFEGQVPDGALVVLHPKDAPPTGALKPMAKVQPDGSFQLTTYETGDGAPAGQYVVTVSWSQVVKNGGDFVPGPELIPPKYVSPKTSDVQVSVAAGQNELQPIALRR